MSLGSSPHKNVEENEKEGDGGEASNQGNTQPQVYEGHRNHQTVKGVNFFGPNTEYVVSGSDCGRIFIWKKKGGKLVALMKGDDTVVNCLEPHPYATILATSGIEDTIKIWSPESERILDLPHDTDRVCLCPRGWWSLLFLFWLCWNAFHGNLLIILGSLWCFELLHVLFLFSVIPIF